METASDNLIEPHRDALAEDMVQEAIFKAFRPADGKRPQGLTVNSMFPHAAKRAGEQPVVGSMTKGFHERSQGTVRRDVPASERPCRSWRR